MKVSEPEERPEKVKPQEYHDAVNQNSNDENVQEKSWSQIQGYSLVAGLRSVGQDGNVIAGFFFKIKRLRGKEPVFHQAGNIAAHNNCCATRH